VLRRVRNDRKAGCYQCSPGVEQARVLQNAGSGVLIGVGSRRRSASQAIDLPSDGGGNLGRLFTPGNLLPQIRVVPCVAAAIP
jgi:hypothetical protein